MIEVDRSGWLGGSDVAAVLGVSPWCTPVDLWMHKTGRAKPEPHDAKREKLFGRGHVLEPFIVEMTLNALREMGHDVVLLACNQRHVDPEYPFLSAEIDFELMLDGEHITADAKSVSGFARSKWGDPGTDEVPIEYACQFQFGLMITGLKRCLVAALRSFDDVDIYWIERDEETIAGIRERMVSFWRDNVLADVAPEPARLADVKMLYPKDDGSIVDASEEVADKVARLATVRQHIRDLKDEESALEFDITNWIRPHATLRFHDKLIASWKAQTQNRLDQRALAERWPEIVREFTRANTIRVLRLKK